MNDSAPSFSALLQAPHSGIHYRIRPVAEGTASGRLLLLHGVGSNERGMIALADSVPANIEVLVLQAPLAIGPEQFAWFQVSFTANGPIINAPQAEQSRRQLIELIVELRDRDADRPVPVVIAGFSQGGILSASVGLSAPTQVLGFGLLSGRILPELAEHLAPAAELATVQAFIAHGRLDNKLPLFWAERAENWLAELGVPHQTHLYDIGHELSAAVVADFNHWLSERFM